MLKVEGLNAGYGSVNILWDIGFEVKDGEIVAILGSNGAGKTTMVRTITGMVKASSGKVEFNGEDLSGKSSRVILDSGIVQVPEGRQLFTEMTVLENLELGAFNKETKAHFAENLEKCYNWFPKLRERAKQAAGTLSGGEQQMVAVARALIGMPKLLILDEPSLGLAPNIVDDILEVAKTMVKNDGISVLLVEPLSVCALPDLFYRTFPFKQIYFKARNDVSFRQFKACEPDRRYNGLQPRRRIHKKA